VEVRRAGSATAVLSVQRAATTTVGRADADGSRAVAVAPVQSRVAAPLEQQGGVAIADVHPPGDGPALPAALRFVDAERVRVLDRIVTVPPIETSGPDTPDEATVTAAVTSAVAAALGAEAETIGRALPRRWVVARAAIDGDVDVRRLLAHSEGARHALYAARVATAERGVPLWWERLERAPRPATATPGTSASESIVAELDRSAQALLDTSGAVVGAAAGTLDTSLPFDLTVVDAATVQAARDLVLDLLGVPVVRS